MTGRVMDTGNTRTTYCERWNGVLRKPIGMMTVDQAQVRHNDGRLYSIALGEPTNPDVFIEIRWEKGYVGVWFFDDDVRRSLKYTFKRINDKRLFMTEVTSWKYPPDSELDLGDARVVDHIRYHDDGTVRREIRDKEANEVRAEEYSNVDVDINWEPVPEFGKWDSLARRDRENAAL